MCNFATPGVTVFVDGKVERFTTYTDPDEARAPAERLAQERGTAVSQANVEVVRSCFVAFNAGDMDCLRDMYDSDVVIRRELEGWPETGPFVGRDAVMRQWERSREPWGNTATLEPVSIIDAGDRVVARQIVHGVGRGPALHAEFTTVSTLRNGRVFLIDFFWDYAEALKAVGLTE
jgi:ketosteroid isomerase-like protein